MEPGSASVRNRDVTKWGGIEKNGTATPPTIGSKIYVTMNKLGPATVKGYFVEGGWLGILVKLSDPPKWWREQNKGEPGRLAHIFGPEFRIVE
jgi:hypothetical protein